MVRDPIAVVKDVTSYVDESVHPDRKYLYTVRGAAAAETPLLLGAPADEVLADTADVFPPPAPDGLLVLTEQGGVRLVWNPVLVPDLAGYRVYRKESGLPAWTKVADGLKETVFFDGAAGPGVQYGVTAVDLSGNESSRAEESR